MDGHGEVPDPIIGCIDCGGRCHLLTTWPPDDPPQPGDVISYRCEDCADRWDLIFGEDVAGIDPDRF